MNTSTFLLSPDIMGEFTQLSTCPCDSTLVLRILSCRCPYCPWSGISSSMLNKHKKREHKNEREKERHEKAQYRTVPSQSGS